MSMDSIVQLINNMRLQQLDAEDPINTTIQDFLNPFDVNTSSDSLITLSRSPTYSFTWGDGISTVPITNNLGQTVQFPACGWAWGFGGAWS
jgi:hypothetical protein